MTKEIFEKICELYSESNESVSIRDACKKAGSSWDSFRRERDSSDELCARYARAIVDKDERELDEIGKLHQEMLQAVGSCDPKCSGAVAQAYRTRIDDLKWKLSKRNPKKYGDRIEQRLSDADGNALQVIFNVPRPPELQKDGNGSKS